MVKRRKIARNILAEAEKSSKQLNFALLSVISFILEEFWKKVAISMNIKNKLVQNYFYVIFFPNLKSKMLA